jgi:hypothetical protein
VEIGVVDFGVVEDWVNKTVEALHGNTPILD